MTRYLRFLHFKKLLTLFIIGQGVFCAQAQEFNTRGFIALDLFSLEKAERQASNQMTGIGTLDLKMYAKKDDLSAKIKLDVDGNLSERFRIFEEALVYYRLAPNWNITFGKGKVPFHQMHWGVIINSYVDGGSVLGAENSIRDFDRKILLSIRYGQFSKGFFNHFSIFGNPDDVRRDRETGEPCFDSSCSATSGSSYVSDSSRSFSLEYQRGLANKFEYFITRNLQVAASALWYRNDLDPDDNFGAGLSLRYRGKELEVWSELTSGQYSRTRFMRYSAKRQVEHWFQLGAEKKLNAKYSVLMNVETQFIDRTNFDVEGDSTHIGIDEKYSTSKIEIGGKYYLSSSAFITVGSIIEKQFFHIESNKREEYEQKSGKTFRPENFGAGFKATLAYWF